MDKVLETKDFKVENKKFFFDLKENPKAVDRASVEQMRERIAKNAQAANERR